MNYIQLSQHKRITYVMNLHKNKLGIADAAVAIAHNYVLALIEMHVQIVRHNVDHFLAS